MPETLTPADHWRVADELRGRIDRELVRNEEVVPILDQEVRDLIGPIPTDVQMRAREHFGLVGHEDVVVAARGHSISPGLRSML